MRQDRRLEISKADLECRSTRSTTQLNRTSAFSNDSITAT